ncbi:hypothetical protein tinsulaeT_11030 [Thalassotalea insulae]|uniref:Uncharacterized protein n=1 Tax=Thalassotalea insulae TaxID=2056778 RepID=A0ABQ6GP62_9GAMM|nr:hypothetical protein tinsulaeT_11030 [Thalassotalea insulae]
MINVTKTLVYSSFYCRIHDGFMNFLLFVISNLSIVIFLMLEIYVNLLDLYHLKFFTDLGCLYSWY